MAVATRPPAARRGAALAASSRLSARCQPPSPGFLAPPASPAPVDLVQTRRELVHASHVTVCHVDRRWSRPACSASPLAQRHALMPFGREARKVSFGTKPHLLVGTVLGTLATYIALVKHYANLHDNSGARSSRAHCSTPSMLTWRHWQSGAPLVGRRRSLPALNPSPTPSPPDAESHWPMPAGA